MPSLKDLFDNLYSEIQDTQIVNHEASALDKKLSEQRVVGEATKEMKKVSCLIDEIAKKIDLLAKEHAKLHADSPCIRHDSKECLEYEDKLENLFNKSKTLDRIFWLLSDAKGSRALRNDWKLVDVSNPDDELKKLLEEFN